MSFPIFIDEKELFLLIIEVLKALVFHPGMINFGYSIPN